MGAHREEGGGGHPPNLIAWTAGDASSPRPLYSLRPPSADRRHRVVGGPATPPRPPARGRCTSVGVGTTRSCPAQDTCAQGVGYARFPVKSCCTPAGRRPAHPYADNGSYVVYISGHQRHLTMDFARHARNSPRYGVSDRVDRPVKKGTVVFCSTGELSAPTAKGNKPCHGLTARHVQASPPAKSGRRRHLSSVGPSRPRRGGLEASRRPPAAQTP